MARLRDFAKTLRSKNCDPFNTTFDVFFDSEEAYRQGRDSGRITAEVLAPLYGLTTDQVLGIYFLDNALAFKVTMVKDIASSDPACKDVFGAHQHLMLADLEIPEEKR